MLVLFFHIIFCELNEEGYLYSVGKKKFLTLDGNDIKIIPKFIMPSMFEIETRPDSRSYTLRIYPSPRQGDKVVDKDWFWNDHKLIIHPTNNWESEHFIFSLVPKNMLKIIVKEKCAEVTDDGHVKARDCKSKKDSPEQYFRWFSKKDKFLVEEYVERHGGKPNRRYDDDEYYNDDFDRPIRQKRYENYPSRPDFKRRDEDSDFFKRRFNNDSDEDSIFNDFNRRFRRDTPRRDQYRDNIMYKYHNQGSGYNDGNRPNKGGRFNEGGRFNGRGGFNDDDDICSGQACDPYYRRGMNNGSPTPYTNTHFNSENRNNRQNKNSPDCDEMIDGIENLICDIESMPNFMS